jgi:hypothetical protein
LSCEGDDGVGAKEEIKRGLRKVQWAVCRKGDVDKFKADLRGHTESIQLLLVTVQMLVSNVVRKMTDHELIVPQIRGKSNLYEKRQDEQQKSLAGRVQEGYFSCMQRLAAVVDQGKQLLDTTATIL